jgi:UDP-N-acetylglucosamine acyltransferase
MAYAHVAHDCQVGDRTIFANSATLAGHVEVHDDVTISAFSAVHQFCRVGRHAYIGGFSVVTMDALPFVKTVGQKPACYGVNTIGLKRKGFDLERVSRIQQAYRLLVRSGLNTGQALARMKAELSGDPDVDYFIAFVEGAKRGVHRSAPRGGGRGGGGDGE